MCLVFALVREQLVYLRRTMLGPLSPVLVILLLSLSSAVNYPTTFYVSDVADKHIGNVLPLPVSFHLLSHSRTINVHHRFSWMLSCCWWEKNGRRSTGTVTCGIQLHCVSKFTSVPMWRKDRGAFKPSYHLQPICETVTAYWSTDKGCLCGQALAFASSAVKICLFFKASLATLKSTSTTRLPASHRPHSCMHTEDKLPRLNVLFIGV